MLKRLQGGPHWPVAASLALTGAIDIAGPVAGQELYDNA